jgi:hypothetical protein
MSRKGGVAKARTRATTRVLTSTGTDGWRTPAFLMASLFVEFDLRFDYASSGSAALGLDPARFYGPGSDFGHDALDESPEAWAEVVQGGAGWLNPPYSVPAGRGRGIWSWHRAAWLASREGARTVLLCPPHPGRAWWREWASRAEEIRVYNGRIPFLDPATGEPRMRWNKKTKRWEPSGNSQDSALFIYGPDAPDSPREGGPPMRHIDLPPRSRHD